MVLLQEIYVKIQSLEEQKSCKMGISYLERHQLLVRRYTIEQVAATNLELRIRFKKQLHVRNMHLSISKKDQVRICGFAYL